MVEMRRKGELFEVVSWTNGWSVQDEVFMGLVFGLVFW